LQIETIAGAGLGNFIIVNGRIIAVYLDDMGVEITGDFVAIQITVALAIDCPLEIIAGDFIIADDLIVLAPDGTLKTIVPVKEIFNNIVSYFTNNNSI